MTTDPREHHDEPSGGPSADEVFEEHRRALTGAAYRILGSWTDAEDVVQDVWLRWAAGHATVADPSRWLSTVTVRAALDRLRRLKSARERYLGPWLPEPISDDPGPEATAERRDTLALGMLVVLESLSPLERTVFVLREGFAWSNADIAEALGKSQDAVRQLAHRAQHHVRQARPRFTVDRDLAAASTELFLRACLDGNVQNLLEVLAPDVVMISDGGGEAPAPRRALVGADQVLAFLAGLGRKDAFAGATFAIGTVNAQPGLITCIDDAVVSAMSFDTDAQGRITAIYVVAAPSKLTHLAPPATPRPNIA
jgi:RNA polymerase sigma-70 factor (ECF subfamily)